MKKILCTVIYDNFSTIRNDQYKYLSINGSTGLSFDFNDNKVHFKESQCGKT